MMNLENCTGCTACYTECPKNCIKMIPDQEGFFHPDVDKEVCIHCGKCIAVCPITFSCKERNLSKAYIAQNTNQYIRKKSSSGGIFSEIARYVIEDLNGVVYGAVFDENWRVHHYGTSNTDDIQYFRGSKYVQSNLQNCFKEIKKLLKEKRIVCFSGVPCQISGLLNCLGGGYKEGLILVDVVCHGVSSPLVWEKYLTFYKELADKRGTNIKNIEFRNKSFGYFASTMCIEFLDGTIENNTNRVQFAKNAYFQGLSLNKCCYNCPSKKNADRLSDITLFDCWHTKQLSTSGFDKNGTTSILVNSLCGKKLIENLKDSIVIEEVDRETLITLDGDMYYKSAPVNLKRKKFFEDINLLSFQKMNKKYFPLSLKKRMIIVMKPILNRLGLTAKIKELLCKKNVI